MTEYKSTDGKTIYTDEDLKEMNDEVERVADLEAKILAVIKQESPLCYASATVRKALQLIEQRFFYT